MLRWLGVEWRDLRDEMPTESSPDGDTERPRDKGITSAPGDIVYGFCVFLQSRSHPIPPESPTSEVHRRK